MKRLILVTLVLHGGKNNTVPVIKDKELKKNIGKEHTENSVYQNFTLNYNKLSQFRDICRSMNLSMSKVIGYYIDQFITDMKSSNPERIECIQAVITVSQYKKHQFK